MDLTVSSNVSFSGYEVRLCAGVDAPVHEVRLHPYLFPVGLGGAPTFSGNGDPKRDAEKYWIAARIAARIGLGGTHLLEDYPDLEGAEAGISSPADIFTKTTSDRFGRVPASVRGLS